MKVKVVFHSNEDDPLKPLEQFRTRQYKRRLERGHDGVFVYDIDKPRPRIPIRKIVDTQISIRIEKLRKELKDNYHLDFNNYSYLEDDVVNLDIPIHPEWTQFYFKFCDHRRGICLKQLKLPSNFRRNGIGTYCVNWLKQFAKDFGFEYIYLGSLDSAYGFWSKMGFRGITSIEADQKYNYGE